MAFIIILTCVMLGLAMFLRLFIKQDGESRARFKVIYNFILLYEKETGIRLSTDQAIALIQLTVASMARNPRQKVYLDPGYPGARRLAADLCAEAERKVWR